MPTKQEIEKIQRLGFGPSQLDFEIKTLNIMIANVVLKFSAEGFK